MARPPAAEARMLPGVVTGGQRQAPLPRRPTEDLCVEAAGTAAGAAQAERSLPSILFRAPDAPLRKRHEGWTCHFLLWGALLLRYNLFIKSRPVPSLSRESLSDDV